MKMTSEEKSETSNDDESDLYEEDEKEGKSTTCFSPFRDHFVDLIKTNVNCKLSLNVNCKRSEYFLPSFIDYLLNNYMPLTPLWTGLLLKSSLQTR